MSLLAVKLLVTPAVVIVASLVGRRWGAAVGGWIGRHLCFLLPLTGVARRNLERVMPDLPADERERVLRRMWDNIGRTAAEYPHIREICFGPGARVTVEGGEQVDALRDDGRPGLMFSGHIGNWELLGPCAVRYDLVLHMVYRAPNNPRVAWLFQWGRDTRGELIPKGAHGARRLLEVLKANQHVAMLVDQKMNDGIAAPFFGIEAMTSNALAVLALRFDCPVVPARIIRLGGAHFRLIVEPPLRFAKSGDRAADVRAAMTLVNAKLESWIRQRPDHWLWVHRRWPAP